MKGILVFALAVVAPAQMIDLSSLDKLSQKAKESSNINLDGDKLRLASGLLSSNNPNEQKAKEAIENITGLRVRTFEFREKSAYSQADLEPIRKQLRGGKWSKVIETKDEDESTEIYMIDDGKDMRALLVISAEPSELTVVNITGSVDLRALGALQGIPNINSAFGSGKAGTPTPPAPPKPARRPED